MTRTFLFRYQTFILNVHNKLSTVIKHRSSTTKQWRVACSARKILGIAWRHVTCINVAGVKIVTSRPTGCRQRLVGSDASLAANRRVTAVL